MKEFNLDKNGNVVETFGDVMRAEAALNPVKKSVWSEEHKVDHYRYCRSCFHFDACWGVLGMCDEIWGDPMCDLTSCKHYLFSELVEVHQ